MAELKLELNKAAAARVLGEYPDATWATSIASDDCGPCAWTIETEDGPVAILANGELTAYSRTRELNVMYAKKNRQFSRVRPSLAKRIGETVPLAGGKKGRAHELCDDGTVIVEVVA